MSLIVKAYIPRSNLTKGGGRFFIVKPGNFRINLREIYEEIKSGRDIMFENCEQSDVLLSAVKVEEKMVGDKEFLRRIILGGGFVSYIQKLKTLEA